jgi:uncharacterized membrane protein
MQMVKKGLFFSLIAWFAFVLFMPKTELYHSLEKVLEKKEIRLNEKQIEEGIFSLEVNDITVYVKGIAIAHIDSIIFYTYLFYTKISFENILIDDSLHAQVPAQTDTLNALHTVMNPLNLSLDANGSFGSVIGEVQLKEKAIKVDFVEVKDISMLEKFLTKGENGWVYEKSF